MYIHAPIGAAYSALLVIMIGTYTSNSPAMFIILNSVSLAIFFAGI